MLGVSEESKACRLYDIEAADENNDIEAADGKTAEEIFPLALWLKQALLARIRRGIRDQSKLS